MVALHGGCIADRNDFWMTAMIFSACNNGQRVALCRGRFKSCMSHNALDNSTLNSTRLSPDDLKKVGLFISR